MLDDSKTQQLIEAIQDALFSTTISNNNASNTIMERVKNIMNDDVVGASETVTETVSVSESGDLVINPNGNKNINPVVQNNNSIRIALGTDRKDDSVIRVPIITDGSSKPVTFSPDFLGNTPSIDTSQESLVMVWVSYITEDKKFAQARQLNAVDDTAPMPTFTPSDGGSLSDLAGPVKVTFNKAVRNLDLTEIDDSNVGKLLTFKETDANGADVPFTATINNAKTEIEATPDSNLSEAQNYYFKVGKVESYSGYEMESGQEITFTASTPQLSDPSSLTVTSGGTDTLDLNWTSNSSGNEDGFAIERSADGSTGWAQIDTVASGITTYSDNTLNPGETKHYRVKAIGGSGFQDSGYSNVDSATTDLETLTAPTLDSANGVSDNTVDLAWTDNTDNETRFSIERTISGDDNWAEIDTVGAGVTTYRDQNSLATGTAYDYRIIAQGDGSNYQNSSPSNVLTATTEAEDTTAPTLDSLVVNNSTPDQLEATYSELVNTSDLGFTLNTDDAEAISITGLVSGDGTNSPIYQLDREVKNTETLTLDYDDVDGDTVDVSSNSNALASFTTKAITNNVEAFTPADVSVFWGAARLESYNDTDAVTSITNQVDDGTNAVAEAGNEPVYRTGQIDGQAVYRALGNGEEMDFQDTYNSMLQKDQYAFVFVCRQLNITDGDHPFVGSGQGTTSDFKISVDVNDDNYEYYYKMEDNNQATEGGGTVDGNANIITYFFDWLNDEILIRKNKSTILTSSLSAIGNADPAQFGLTETLKLFGYKNDPTANMEMAEFNFGDMDFANVQNCEDYYDNQYTI